MIFAHRPARRPAHLPIDLLVRVYRGVLEAAWHAALDATDWDALAAERLRLPDERFGALLEGTLVARAAQRCYAGQLARCRSS